ncbi:MAG: protease SohB [Gammaproteobacteria bacterium]|nr:protease SohB [Gammaproteobacteria bacterium]
MLEFLYEYGLFLAKSLTIVAAIVVVVALVASMQQRGRREESGHLEVINLNDRLRHASDTLKQAILTGDALKAEQKAKKKADKESAKAAKREAKNGSSDEKRRPRLFVLDFLGDIQASAVTGLREEISAVLEVASGNDEVLIRLESPGGLVHSYGLAASQLRRIRNRAVTLTVAVDNVAASGGYMMACIADRIIAAPFAVLGSIGVAAQVANVHNLLKKNDVEVDVLTAGEYKRTLTTFGENTEAGREKFIEELEDVHTLFKDFVADNRASVNVDEVSTGEAWYGTRALERHLVDELQTSDEFIVARSADYDVYAVRFIEHKTRVEKLLDQLETGVKGLTGFADIRPGLLLRNSKRGI